MPDAKSFNTFLPKSKFTVMDLLCTSTVVESDLRSYTPKSVLDQYDYLFVKVVVFSNGAATERGNDFLIPVADIFNSPRITAGPGYTSFVDAVGNQTSDTMCIIFLIYGYDSDSSCGISYWWAQVNPNYTSTPTYKCLVYGLR